MRKTEGCGAALRPHRWGPAFALIALMPLVNPSPARAVLGEPSGTVEGDRQLLSGATRTISAAQYIVEEITAPTVVVREYVNESGLVFAVTWRGKRPPNLPSLLGSYFQHYADVLASAQGPGRKSSHVETSRLVVDTGGHMGAVWGRAYVPALLPSGVTKELLE